MFYFRTGPKTNLELSEDIEWIITDALLLNKGTKLSDTPLHSLRKLEWVDKAWWVTEDREMTKSTEYIVSIFFPAALRKSLLWFQ